MSGRLKLVLASGAWSLVVVPGALLVAELIHPHDPAPPEPCVDAYVNPESSYSVTTCDGLGARIEYVETKHQTLVFCKCPAEGVAQ